MGMAGSIFEPNPPDFGKILIFWRCSNDSKTNFWYFQWYKKYQKSVGLSIQLIPRSTSEHTQTCQKPWVAWQPHCKFLQGTVGSLQGIQATGISYLQGFSMHVITCKEFIGIAINNYRDIYCFFINQGKSL